MEGDAGRQFRQAVEIYLNLAYGEREIPQRVTNRLDVISADGDIQAVLAADSFELENHSDVNRPKCFKLRLGNFRYPHMKLAVQETTSGKHIFSIDTHDQHFDVPTDSDDAEEIRKLRDFNESLKMEIEHNWAQIGLITFCEQIKTAVIRLPDLADDQSVILLVEDEIDIMDAERQILEMGGFRVLAFQDGSAALQAVRNGEIPDLCILDIMMRDMDGFQIRDAVREEIGPDIPVIFVSGLPVDALEKSGEEFLQKPFMGEDLLNKVDDLLKAVV